MSEEAREWKPTPPDRARNSSEEAAVRRLGDAIGYGRMMQLAEQIWRAKLVADGLPPGGEITTGPCAVFMVPCPHPVLDSNGHCEVCCGAGRVTKWVRDNLPARD